MNAAAHDTQGAKARKSAALCYALAVLVMLVTAFFIIEGVQSTEPESPTRHAKVAAGVLLLVLEMAAFSLAGQWRDLSPILRALGWAIFVLQVVLMSLTQIATGTTAAKSASLSTATVEEIRAQADASRQTAKSLLADAEKARTSKNAWVRQQAGEKSTAAAQQTAAGADAVAQLKQLQAVSTSTPVLEMIGKPGLIALSISLSLILELAGITLMHCAGTLRRRADGAVPVDVQILELLHRVHGQPGAPVAPAQIATPAAAPAQVNYRPAGTVAPTSAPTGLSYGGKMMLAGGGALAAMAAPVAHSAPHAPAAPTQAKAPATPLASPANGASETVQSDASVSVQSHGAESVQSGASETAGTTASVSVQTGASVSVQSEAKTPRVKRAVSAKLDTGTDGKAGARYKRIKAAVKAGKLKPSLRAIQATEGGSQDVVLDYLRQLESEGVIVRAGRGFVLASKSGGAA